MASFDIAFSVFPYVLYYGKAIDCRQYVDYFLPERLLWGDVIVRELLHFFVPNHGRLWKSLMRAHLGAYEAHEAELKRIAQN